MTRLLKTRWRSAYDEIVVVFSNTGAESKQTLEFVDRCDKAFGFETVWIEAVVNEKGKGTSHKVVTFETASREGEPFEAVIQKYGIPNSEWLHCTRELKTNPMLSYIASLGWEKGTYDTAIGIRKDEEKRRAARHVENHIVYPLMDLLPTTKPEVNRYWMNQPFRLELAGYQGNCRWCWKKSLRKHMTLISEDPSIFDFPARMEEQYGHIGAEFEKDIKPKYEKRVFFRGNRSTKDLMALYQTSKHVLAEDDAMVLPEKGLFDEDEGCVESCEVEIS